MWKNDKNFPARGFSTPPPSWKSRPFRSPKMPLSERKRSSPNSENKSDLFHVIHKVPSGDSPYVKAKQVQLIDKDPSRAVSLFWAAINAGDRVDSALKDMAIVMKQLDRSDEAIEAIKSFRHLCPYDSQESIDNVLVELYKRSGRIEEEIEMLRCKLRQIEEGKVFGGKRTKAARSQGKKVQITIEQETSRVLGNLAWAYLQQNNIRVAEGFYRKALSLEPDNNKKCNLAICLIHMNRIPEAKSLLQSVGASSGGRQMEESYVKSFERALHMLAERESQLSFNSIEQEEDNSVMTTIKRESNEVNSSAVGVQHCVSGLTASTRGNHDDEEIYLNEYGRDYYHRNHHENNDVFGVVDGNLQCKSFGGANSSHDYLHGSKWNKGSNIENLWKKNSSFPINMKKNQDGVLRVYGSSKCRTLYSSPIPVRSNVEVPFTQPKNCSWGFDNGHQPKERWQNRMSSGSNRKVLFEHPTMNDSFQSLPIRKFDIDFADATSESEETGAGSNNYEAKYCSASPDATELEVPFTQPRSCSWGFNGGHQRRGIWYRDFTGSSNRKLSFEHPTSAENIQALADPSLERSDLSRAMADPNLGADWNQISCRDNDYNEVAVQYDSTNAGSPFTDCQNGSMMNEEECLQKNCPDKYNTIEQKLKHNSLIVGSKKSWADMVEEEEEEKTEEEFSTGGQADYLGDWSSDEDFNDENLNSNILHQNHSPSNQVEEISQIKFGSLDIKDGNRDPDDIILSRNPAVRRPLYFDQQPKLESTDNYHSLPLPRKDLTAEVSNSEQENRRDTISGENVNLTRRNRLQVFQEITVHQEVHELD